jgi:hypothetical protein
MKPPFVTSYCLEISFLWQLLLTGSGHWFISAWWTLCRTTSNFFHTSLCITQPGCVIHTHTTSQQHLISHYIFWHVKCGEFCRRFKGTSVFLISQSVFWASRRAWVMLAFALLMSHPFWVLRGKSGCSDWMRGTCRPEDVISSCSWSIPLTMIIQLSTL